MFRLITLVSALVLTALPASGQQIRDTYQLRAGDRIRFATTEQPQTKIMGHVLQSESMQFRIKEQRGGERVVQFSDLASLELRLGRNSRTLRGFALGVGSGQVAGLLLGAAIGGEGQYILRTSLSVVGGITGLIIGANTGPEIWRTIRD